MSDFSDFIADAGSTIVANVPDGLDAQLAVSVARASEQGVVFIARDEQRLAQFADYVRFFAPELDVLSFPAWDCLPYDRASPNRAVVAQRMRALGRMADGGLNRGQVLITTVNAALQLVPPRESMAQSGFHTRTGASVKEQDLIDFLTRQGYVRTGTVMEPGEFAIRGGLIDIFPPMSENPYRLDLFGSEVEQIRLFDAISQRTLSKVDEMELTPVSELPVGAAAKNRFRVRYRELFGNNADQDPIYLAVSEERHLAGAEHWAPLFHKNMDSLFDYVGNAPVLVDHLTDDSADARFSAIEDYYETRRSTMKAETTSASLTGTYRPVPPGQMYLDDEQWAALLAARPVARVTPFSVETPEGVALYDAGGRLGRDFAPERNTPGTNIYQALAGFIKDRVLAGKQVVMASYSAGARERLSGLLKDEGVRALASTESYQQALDLPKGAVGLTVLPCEHGFETEDFVLISEQDVLGDRLVRPRRRSRKAENFISSATELQIDDFIVHVDHGIGRYQGLKTIDVNGAPHDCLQLEYFGGDKLFLPVENIELLTRYAAGDAEANLDRLGGKNWQARKAKLKERLKDMAEDLIRIAAERELTSASSMSPADGAYQEFCDRFPFQETDDQAKAIADVVGDLGKGRPMDRLVCGDVGFGKTEVALRTAFVAALEGMQVAIVAPTTLLARQHYRTFVERFRDFPVKIGQLSRLVSGKDATLVKQGIANGDIDIVVGTHALLGKSISFKRLGVLIVDEEQHFGVKHKERLKELKADIHVLTLTATPIPRTLQLALTGIRDLSIIATPPVDRLAVRTFVMPFDEVVLREALLREHYRGGQSFFVCPRISDLKDIQEFLKAHVPEVRFATANGQMAAGDLEDVMTAFYEGKFDVLVATNIVESGLDVPTANTMIVHRADMFGLAQLYQLRGRIGRSKTRAYAYLSVPANKKLTDAAEKRLKVLQTLDQLGAGFTLASHDLDIRGAGNLLGDEQSGQIREVGAELYQHMLEEAVAEAKGVSDAGGEWSPAINTGAPVLIPDYFVQDLQARLDLYRRLAHIDTEQDIEAIAAEMIDRFGELPPEVDNLFDVVAIKRLCRTANIAKLDAGPKGATVQFKDNTFPDPAGLVQFISRHTGQAKLRPDHSLVFLREWSVTGTRIKGVRRFVSQLAQLAEKAAAA